MMIMKKILSVFPVGLIILALLTCGGKTMAQQQVETGKAKKEVNQAKQKGKDKVKEAEEAAEKEEDKATEAVQKEEEKSMEALQKEEEKAAEAVNKEEEKAREAMNQEKEKVRDAADTKEGKEAVKGRGNAFGKNKGGLEGRDFGQARAEEARMKNQEKKSELDRKVEDGEQRTVQARERIRVAREELEKEKGAKKINDETYQQKKEKIDNAEKAVIDLEEKIKKGKSVPGEI